MSSTKTEKIKILFFIHYLLGYGGTERHLLELIKGLDKEKFMPIVCCFTAGGFAEEIRSLGVKVFVLPVNKLIGIKALKSAIRLCRILNSEKIKIVQTFHTKPDLYVPLIAKLCGIRFVISSRRDLGFNKTEKHVWFQRIISNFVDKILVNSKAVGDMCVKRESIKSKKIVLIHNGIPEMFFRKVDILNKEKSEDNLFYVGTASNLNEIKGLDFFIEACPLILKRIPNARFLLIGEGPMRSRLEAKIKDFNLAEKITITGNLKEVRGLMAKLDVYVNSSLSEGFSTAILESMALAKPVVATIVGGNPEAVIDGETGFLVPPKDPKAIAEAVVKVLADRDLAKKLGENGKARAAKLFLLEDMLLKYQLFYQGLPVLAQQRKKELFSEISVKIFQFSRKIVKNLISLFIFYSGILFLIKKFFYKHQINILAYHKVEDNDSDFLNLSLTLNSFESQLRYIHSNYKFIGLEKAVELLKSKTCLKEDLFVVTFDDGYKNNLQKALPVLRKYKIPATIFLTAGVIDKGEILWYDLIAEAVKSTKAPLVDLCDYNLRLYPLNTQEEKTIAAKEIVRFLKYKKNNERESFIKMLLSRIKVEKEYLYKLDLMLTWEEAKEMRQYDISFASHGMSHAILTNLEPKEMEYEIAESKKIIEDRIKERVSYFSYPNGSVEDFNEETIRFLKDNGYQAACTLIQERRQESFFKLGRKCVTKGMSAGLTGKFSRSLFECELFGLFNIFKDKNDQE